MELKGKIKVLNDTKEYGTNGFKKRELVINTGGDYPQFITIEFIKDKCDVLNDYNLGDEVTIACNIQGREWDDPKSGETKYFNSIQGWKISKEGDVVSNVNPVPNEDESGDLPF